MLTADRYREKKEAQTVTTYSPSKMAPRTILASLVVALRAPLKLPIVPGTTNATVRVVVFRGGVL